MDKLSSSRSHRLYRGGIGGIRGGGEVYPPPSEQIIRNYCEPGRIIFERSVLARRRQFQYISRDYKHSLVGDSSILHYLTTPATSLSNLLKGADRSPWIIHITRSRLTYMVLARHWNSPSSVSMILIARRD